MFIAANTPINPAPYGAECNRTPPVALRWSAMLFQAQSYKHRAPPEHFTLHALAKPFSDKSFKLQGLLAHRGAA
jgi:hypothetical protein